jgi:Flp pilus assembly pilin Flp
MTKPVMKLLTVERTRKDRGVAMTEYLVILGIIALVLIAVVGKFGKQIENAFYQNASISGRTEAEKDQSQKLDKDATRTANDAARP